MYFRIRKLRSVQENFIGIWLIDSTLYTLYPACDIIKIDIFTKQNGGWMVLFVLCLTTDITIASKVLVDK